MKTITISELRRNNSIWFESCPFLGTILCKVVEKDNTQYLLEITHKWSDMFKPEKDTYYLIRDISNGKVGEILKEFEHEGELIEYLK